MTATYTKLKSGEWGIRVVSNSPPTVGTTVTVSKKSGETKTETVGKVLWSGNGVHLCTVGGSKKSYTPTAGKRRGRNEDDRCELCDGNKWTCGHCIGW